MAPRPSGPVTQRNSLKAKLSKHRKGTLAAENQSDAKKNDAKLTIKVPVGSIADEGPGTKINQFEIHGAKVHQQVFIFDVAVNDALPITSQHSFHHLAKKVASQVFVEHAFLGDKVEQVLAGFGSLHHDNEGVVSFEAVKDLDHSWTTIDFA